MSPRGLIQTHKGWRPMFDLKDVSPEQRERDRRIAEWRAVTDREQDDRRGVLRDEA